MIWKFKWHECLFFLIREISAPQNQHIINNLLPFPVLPKVVIFLHGGLKMGLLFYVLGVYRTLAIAQKQKKPNRLLC